MSNTPNTPNYDELLARHQATMEQLAESEVPIKFELDAVHAMVLIGLLQLTTRHPMLPDNSRRYARELAGQLAAAVRVIAPDTAEIVALGWQKEYDF